MYENDLAALLRYLGESGRTVEIRAGKAAWLDDAADLVELRRLERLELRLTVEDPSVEVALGANARVWTNQVGDPRATQLVDGVMSLCQSWKTWTARFALEPFLGAVFAASLIALALGFGALIGGDIEVGAWIVGPPSILAAFTILGLLGTAHRIYVSPRSRHAAAERRLQVLGTIAISLVSGAAGSVATWLLALKG